MATNPYQKCANCPVFIAEECTLPQGVPCFEDVWQEGYDFAHQEIANTEKEESDKYNKALEEIHTNLWKPNTPNPIYPLVFYVIQRSEDNLFMVYDKHMDVRIGNRWGKLNDTFLCSWWDLDEAQKYLRYNYRIRVVVNETLV